MNYSYTIQELQQWAKAGLCIAFKLLSFETYPVELEHTMQAIIAYFTNALAQLC